MDRLLTVTFGDGDLVEQLFALKLSALRNEDTPTLWRLTDELIAMAIAMAKADTPIHWPAGYISETRLFNVPIDPVRNLPHLLCENYMIYPFTVTPPHICSMA